MASEPEADAAARLEAALERIARRAQATAHEASHAGSPGPADTPDGPARTVVIARLDRIIARLREALDQGA